MFKWLKKQWVRRVLFPIHKRKIRNGVTALLYLEQRLNEAGFKRQYKRQVFRQLIRKPAHFNFIYDLLYAEHNIQRGVE